MSEKTAIHLAGDDASVAHIDAGGAGDPPVREPIGAVPALYTEAVDATELPSVTSAPLARNVGWSYANWAVSFLLPLVLVPLFVRYLGAGLYGQWIIILSVVSYLGLAELGFSQAFGNRAAETIAAGRPTELRRLVSSAFFAYAATAAALLALFAAAGLLLWTRLVGESDGAAYTAFAAAFILTACAFPLKIHTMLLRSHERVDREQSIGLWSNLIRSVAMALALLAGFKLIAIAAVHGLSVLANGLAAYFQSARITPAARPRLADFSIETMRSLVKPGLAFWMLGVSHTLMFGLDNLVIGYVLGAEAVTGYAVPMRLVMVPMGLFAVGFASLWPTVTRHYSRGNLDVLQSGFRLGVRLALLYGVASAVALWIAGPAIVEAWVGPGIFPGRATFALQLAMLVIQVLVIPADTVLMATTRHYGYAAAAIGEGILNLGLSLWWIHLFGLPGVIAGTVVARLLTNGWYMPVAALRTLELPVAPQLARLAPASLIALAAICAAAVLGEHIGQSLPLALAGAGSLAIVFIALFTFVGLSRADRASGLSLLGGLIRQQRAA